MAKAYSLSEPVALRHARFAIKPLVKGKSGNNGLSEYNMVIHDGIIHTDIVACVADGRTKTYITGMDEKAPAIQELKRSDPEKYEAKVIQVRRLVARAEREIAGNYDVADPDTKEIEKVPDFWSKVKTFRSVIPDVYDNQGMRVPTYWDELSVKLGNGGIILDENKIKDIVIISVIEAGGFSMIAPSYQEAVSSPVGYKFYLDKKEDTTTIKIADTLVREKAGSKLLQLLEKDTNKLFYITKLISADSLFFKSGKNSTPNNVLYQECYNYIEGMTPVERSKKAASEKLLTYTDMKVNELKIRAALNDTTILNQVVYRVNNLVHEKTGTILGKNVEECVQFLLSAGNVEIHDSLIKQAEREWNG